MCGILVAVHPVLESKSESEDPAVFFRGSYYVAILAIVSIVSNIFATSLIACKAWSVAKMHHSNGSSDWNIGGTAD